MAFKAADSAFPDPHETIDDALQDAEEKSATSNRNLSESQSIYARGQVLEAVALLNDVETDCMHASTRFDDIEQHLTRVQQQRDTNDRQIKQSLNRAEALHRELKDPRITRPTIDRYEGIASEMHSIRQALAQGNTKRDPFAEAKPMKALSDRIDELQAQLDGDKNAHAEAFRAVRGAKTQLVTAQRLVDRAATDDIPDSPLTTQCVREVRELDGALTVTEKRLDIAHDQWQEVDADAARIHSSLGVTIGRLQGELEGAQRTVESFRLASRNVIQATRWSGPFGIRVHGSPGAQELERARAFLNSGDYGSVARMVRAASMAAQSAIQQAEREVARKRRDEARRAEAARRRRMRSAGAVGGLGGLGGGGRSSRPSRTFNRPSAPSRPSRPNNSGFSRSGW